METSEAASYRGGGWRLALGWTVVVLVLVAVVGALTLLTFSVRVTGSSMVPTLRDGDRVLADVLNRGDVRRFDLVEATAPDTGATIVKRVVGLPGDRVMVRGSAGEQEVLVRRAGSSTVERVRNAAWAGSSGRACCGPDGRDTGQSWTTVPDDAYWLLGDNWTGSTDSRRFGFVTREALGARLVLRVLPLGDAGRLPRPAELVPLDD